MKNRRSIRLKEYNYSQNGTYFITICTQDRECLFGNVVCREMVVNDAGSMVQKWWLELKNKFSTIVIDEYVVMPNHFHGLITMVNPVGADLRVCPDSISDSRGAKCDEKTGAECLEKMGAHIGAPLPEMMQWFKTMTTNEYIRGVKQNQWPSFNQRLWQRNYYEHIVRDELSLNRIREYIQNNPLQWEWDENNPLWYP